jgi:uncharacterized protein (TIGR02145 family)
MKNKVINSVLFLCILFCLFSHSCKKEREEIPAVITGNIFSVTSTSATCGVTITSEGSATVTVSGVCWGITENPTISDNKTTDGSGSGSFLCNMSGLSPNTCYFLKSYATNKAGTSYGKEISFTTLSSDSGIFTDQRDGHKYKTLKLGTQIWMAENLAYLPEVTILTKELSFNSSFYIYDYRGSNVATAKTTYNYATYGVLYNYMAAVNSCPSGWHLPSDSEWEKLTQFLGGESVAGRKLKEAGYEHWSSNNINANNESGFTGLPSGFINSGGDFWSIGGIAQWWSSSQSFTDYSWTWVLYDGRPDISKKDYYQTFGISVRCIKD